MRSTTASRRLAQRVTAVAFLVAGSATAASAQTPSGMDFISTGGNVSVRFIGASAADISTLFYRIGTYSAAATDYTPLFTNLGPGATAAGTQIVIGNVAAGTPIVFRLINTTEGNALGTGNFTFYSGAASRNPDNAIHIGLTAGSGLAATGGGTYTQGFNFEDKSGTVPSIDGSLADFDYNDLNYEIANAAAANVIPEPGTWALLGTGLLGLAGMSSRRRKQQR